MTVFSCFLFTAVTGYAQQRATIYQTLDANGNIIYSDKPIDKNTKIVTLPAENLVGTQPPPVVQKDTATKLSAEMALDNIQNPYKTFVLLEPTNEATYQNQPTINVIVDVSPNLKQYDRVQIYLDGKPWGEARPITHFEFSRPDRGEHQVYAVLLNPRGEVIKTTSVNTIFVHQQHLGN